MEKTAENFQVDISGRNAEGDRIEPEEAPTAQVVQTPPVMQMAGGPDPRAVVNGDGSKTPLSQLGAMPVSIAVEAQAGQLAMNLKSQCSNCEYWSRDNWLAMKAQLERGIDAKAKSMLDRYRDEIRFMLADAEDVQIFDPDSYERTERDVERHLNSMGICHALCELMGKIPEEAGGGLQLTFPSGGCPIGMEIPGVGTTVGDMFRARGAEGSRRAALAYDEILMLAKRATLK